MDLLIVLLFISVYSAIRILKTGVAPKRTTVKSSTNSAPVIDLESIPVGANWERKKELDAFEKIVKELGLKK